MDLRISPSRVGLFLGIALTLLLLSASPRSVASGSSTQIPLVVPHLSCASGVVAANYPTLGNNRGDVAGWAPSNCEGDFTAWVWRNGVIYNLGRRVPTSTTIGTVWYLSFQSFPLDMNEAGQVVGWASGCLLQCKRPMLWDPARHYMGIDLAALPPSGGPPCYYRAIPPTCYVEGKATAINEAGEILISETWYDLLANRYIERTFIFRHGVKQDAATAHPFVP